MRHPGFSGISHGWVRGVFVSGARAVDRAGHFILEFAVAWALVGLPPLNQEAAMRQTPGELPPVASAGYENSTELRSNAWRRTNHSWALSLLFIARFFLHFGRSLIGSAFYLLRCGFGCLRCGFTGVLRGVPSRLAGLLDVLTGLFHVVLGGLTKRDGGDRQQ